MVLVRPYLRYTDAEWGWLRSQELNHFILLHALQVPKFLSPPPKTGFQTANSLRKLPDPSKVKSNQN